MHGKPRTVRGGRSARYEVRRALRGPAAARAPEWSDAAAEAVLQTLEEANERVTGRKEVPLKKVTRLLGSSEGARVLVKIAGGKVGAVERPLIEEIVQRAHQKVARCLLDGDKGEAEEANRKAEQLTRSFLKPLRARRALLGTMKPLTIPAAKTGPQSFHCWLGNGVQGEQVRPAEKSQRMLLGLSKWPMDWLEVEGVVCYERAFGRVRHERPEASGVPDEGFVRGLIKIWDLPTAVANPADHYVVVYPGEEPRYMRTSEMARAFMIPETSALMPILLGQRRIGEGDGFLLSAVQAASCLGRCVHTGVARQIVRELVRRGLIGCGASYGSAFSGIDTFAAAVEAELRGDFVYEFASEKDKVVRAALMESWGRYGLECDLCFHCRGR